MCIARPVPTVANNTSAFFCPFDWVKGLITEAQTLTVLLVSKIVLKHYFISIGAARFYFIILTQPLIDKTKSFDLIFIPFTICSLTFFFCKN